MGIYRVLNEIIPSIKWNYTGYWTGIVSGDGMKMNYDWCCHIYHTGES